MTRRLNRLTLFTTWLVLWTAVVAEGSIFGELGPLRAGDTVTKAEAASRDGRVVVGWGSGDGTFAAWRWTETEGMQHLDLPASPAGAVAVPLAVSADGSEVLGTSGGHEWFRWSRTGGYQLIRPPHEEPLQVAGTSRDGTARAGTLQEGGTYRAFHETPGGGLQFIGGAGTRAYGISPDGLTVIGVNDATQANPDPDGAELRGEPFQWNAATGYRGLGFLPGYTHGALADVSADATVAVGRFWRSSSSPGYPPGVAFRWSASEGLASLGTARREDAFSSAGRVTDDGSTVYGFSGRCVRFNCADEFDNDIVAFVWDAGRGMRVLRDALAQEHGLADELRGWSLREVVGVSADGRVIVGNGIDPEGNRAAWVAVIPEPGMAASVAVAVMGCLRRRRSRARRAH